jgi:hypothetical protein
LGWRFKLSWLFLHFPVGYSELWTARSRTGYIRLGSPKLWQSRQEQRCVECNTLRLANHGLHLRFYEVACLVSLRPLNFRNSMQGTCRAAGPTNSPAMPREHEARPSVSPPHFQLDGMAPGMLSLRSSPQGVRIGVFALGPRGDQLSWPRELLVTNLPHKQSNQHDRPSATFLWGISRRHTCCFGTHATARVSSVPLLPLKATKAAAVRLRRASDLFTPPAPTYAARQPITRSSTTCCAAERYHVDCPALPLFALVARPEVI